METIEAVSPYQNTSGIVQDFGGNDLADKTLTTAALLLLFLAIISQWSFGFYTADYYDGTALRQRLEISNQFFSTIDFNCHHTFDDI